MYVYTYQSTTPGCLIIRSRTAGSPDSLDDLDETRLIGRFFHIHLETSGRFIKLGGSS